MSRYIYTLVVKAVSSGIRLSGFEAQFPALRLWCGLFYFFHLSFLICKVKTLKFLLHEVGVRLVCLVAQSCLTLCDPWSVARQAPLSMGILQARIPEWVAMPSFRGSSQPRGRTQVSHIAGRFFTDWAKKCIALGNSLVIQCLGLWASTVGAMGSFLVRKL